jgi:hypothetical protein
MTDGSEAMWRSARTIVRRDRARGFHFLFFSSFATDRNSRVVRSSGGVVVSETTHWHLSPYALEDKSLSHNDFHEKLSLTQPSVFV